MLCTDQFVVIHIYLKLGFGEDPHFTQQAIFVELSL